MKNALLFSGVALAAAIVGYTLATPGGRASAGAPTSAAVPDLGDLHGELSRLTEQMGQLADQMQVLDVRQSALEQSTAFSRSEVQAVEGGPALRADDAPAGLGPTVSSPRDLEAMILGVVEAQESREELEREKLRQQFFEDRLNERMLELERELNLSGDQSESVRELLADQATRRDEFFSDMRENGTFDREVMRDAMREIHRETNEGLQRVLQPHQYERYEELEQRDDSDRGRGGNRGGGGGRGGERPPRDRNTPR